MNRKEIFNRLNSIFQDIFDDQGLEVVETTNSDEIEDWDSLNHINLVVAIEMEFEVKFSINELTSFKDVADMVDLIILKVHE
jgi:acyl carrier protein